MSAIELENVYYSYVLSEDNIIKAVRGISLKIEEGSFVAMVGHNGSGKSTIAKLLNGLLVPDYGKVRVFGMDTQDKEHIFDVRKSVGMVFQNPDNQMVASIIEDDIAFGPENLGIEREEIIRRVDWALDKVHMLEHKKGTPFKLSGGQKQRLAIAGIIAMKPKVIVFDESTAMLDPQGRKEVMEVAHELNKEGMTVICITHYMEEALGADRLIVLNDGKIALDGKPKEVFSQYEKIKENKIHVPLATKIAISLDDIGVKVGKDIMEKDELVDKLCQLL
ncbi:MAG: energy-coupling factor transporter ATPase [Clostridiales bacterium]|nr:energy-coupling factor transporter ATPase [Clostridiales bacterium]